MNDIVDTCCSEEEEEGGGSLATASDSEELHDDVPFTMNVLWKNTVGKEDEKEKEKEKEEEEEKESKNVIPIHRTKWKHPKISSLFPCGDVPSEGGVNSKGLSTLSISEEKKKKEGDNDDYNCYVSSEKNVLNLLFADRRNEKQEFFLESIKNRLKGKCGQMKDEEENDLLHSFYGLRVESQVCKDMLWLKQWKQKQKQLKKVNTENDDDECDGNDDDKFVNLLDEQQLICGYERNNPIMSIQWLKDHHLSSELVPVRIAELNDLIEWHDPEQLILLNDNKKKNKRKVINEEYNEKEMKKKKEYIIMRGRQKIAHQTYLYMDNNSKDVYEIDASCSSFHSSSSPPQHWKIIWKSPIVTPNEVLVVVAKKKSLSKK
jgi:hypothetical protein